MALKALSRKEYRDKYMPLTWEEVCQDMCIHWDDRLEALWNTDDFEAIVDEYDFYVEHLVPLQTRLALYLKGFNGQ